MTSCNLHSSARRKQLRVHLWKPRHSTLNPDKGRTPGLHTPFTCDRAVWPQVCHIPSKTSHPSTQPCPAEGRDPAPPTRGLPQASGPLREGTTRGGTNDTAASIKESMKRQNEMAEKCFQRRNKIKTQKKQLNEERATKKKKNRVMMVKMVQDLGKRMRQRLRTYKRCLTKSYKM